MKTAIFDQADYFKNLAKANREIVPESNIQVDLYFQAKLEKVTTAELLSGAVLTSNQVFVRIHQVTVLQIVSGFLSRLLLVQSIC
jgi:hypothetical protein